MATRQSRNKSRSDRRRARVGLGQIERLEGRQLLAMTLTPAATSMGLTLSTFASGFPNTGTNGIGPLGAAYGASGSVYVADAANNQVYVFPTEADGQGAGAVSSVSYPSGATGMATVGGHSYLATGGSIVRLNEDGTKDTSFAAIPLPGALGIGADTKNGHLFVSANSNLYDVNPASNSATLFLSGTGTDGVTVSPDGNTVFGADNGNSIEGFDTTSKAKVFSTSIATADGSAVGDGPFAGNIFANTNDGRIVEVSLASGAQTVISSGGSRGDFASVDPHNGTFLISQTDSELRLSSNVAKPTIGSISPTSVQSGTSPVTVTVNGSGYFSDATLQLNGADLATTVVNSGQLTATIPASDLYRSGPVNLTVSNPGFGGGLSPSQSFMINPGPLAQFAVTGLTNGVAGSVEHATVQAEDAQGNVVTSYSGTVHFTSNDPNAVLPADATLASGVGTFPVTFKTSGTDSLTATDTATPSVTGTESGVSISPASTTHLVVTGLAGGMAGTVEQATVLAQDAYGNVVPSYDGTVHFTSNDPNAVLPADATLTSGTRTFPVTFKTAGSDSLTATDTATPSITGTDSGIAVSPASTTHLVVTGLAGGTAGTVEQATVLAQDAYGNVVSSYAGTVHFTSNDPNAILPANATLNSGIGSFPVTFKTAGPDSLTATDAATPSITGTESGVAVTPASTTHLVVSGLTNGVAGTVEQATVQAEDAYGNVVPSYEGTIHFTSNDPNAALPADATLTSGVGTFPVTLKTSGTDSLTATDTATPSIAGTESGIAVSPAAPTHLVVSGLTNGVAGTVEQATVQAEDPYGNVVPSYEGTIHFTSNDPNAVLPADATLTSGVGTFPVTLKKAGTDSVTATDTATPSITGTDGSLVISPAAPTHLVVTGLAGGVAGSVEHATVQAQDAYGNVVPSYIGTVHFTSNDPNAVLPADAALTSGVGSFPVTFKAAGTDSVTVTDTTTPNPLTAGTESGIAVSPAAPTHLVVTGMAGGMAGTVEMAIVLAEDAYSNIVPSYSGTVHFTSNDPSAILPADATLTSGLGNFPVTFKTAGTDSLTATDTETPSITGTDPSVNVISNAATHLVVTGLASGNAGTVEHATVTAEDAYSNVVVTYSGTVHFTSNDPNAVLPADATLASGVGTFPVTFKTSGTDSLTATDTATPSITGTDGSLVISPAAATHLAVTGLTGGTAGTVEQATVQAEDPYGNVVPTYAGTVHFTSSDPNVVLPADVALTSGVGTFPVTLKKAGSDSVTATDIANPAISGTDSGVVVSPASATTLVVTGLTSGVAGSVEHATVQAQDAYGNIATSYSGTVRISSTDPGTTVPPTATLTNGIGTFDVTLGASGGQSISVTDSSNAGLSGSDTSLAVSNDIRGVIYDAYNAENARKAGEPAMAGRVLFLDMNHDGVLGAGDPTATTDANGSFAFPGVLAGSATVLEATSQDATDRYVVDQTSTAADGSLAIGLVPISPVAPVPVVPTPFSATPSADANTAFVQSLYHAVLGRVGADFEVATWLARLDAKATRTDIAANFVNSPEHRQDQVVAYYREFLHRAPDPNSVVWVNDLLGGMSEERVAEGFIASAEYQSAHQDSTHFVQDLYLDVLGRVGESTGISAWLSALSSGASRAEVAADFVQSTEAIDQVVESFYASYLHRQLETGTPTPWSDILAGSKGSATVVASDILASPEFDADSITPRS